MKLVFSLYSVSNSYRLVIPNSLLPEENVKRVASFDPFSTFPFQIGYATCHRLHPFSTWYLFASSAAKHHKLYSIEILSATEYHLIGLDAILMQEFMLFEREYRLSQLELQEELSSS